EGTGAFLDVDNTVNGLWSRCELQGNTGTYVLGSPSNSTMLLDQQANFQTYPFNLSYGRIQLNNQGVAAVNSFQSGAAGATADIRIGRTGTDGIVGVSAGANSYVSGDAAGDLVIETLASASIWIAPNQGASGSAQFSPTGVNTYGTGTLRQGIVLIQPSANTDVLTVKNVAGTIVFDINTSPTPQVNVVNGSNFIIYSDSFSTQKFTVNGLTGNVNAAGAIVSAAGGITATTGNFNAGAGVYQVAGVQVAAACQTGWTAPTGTLSRTTFDQSTVTLPELAKRLAALITDLTAHGLIGP
ncbi:MAG: hypothetical protein ACRETL_07850, partial [Gammaproteobacteria bacterium]